MHCRKNAPPHPSRSLISEVLNPEDGGDTSLQNDGNHLQNYMASQPQRPQLTTSPPSEPQT